MLDPLWLQGQDLGQPRRRAEPSDARIVYVLVSMSASRDNGNGSSPLAIPGPNDASSRSLPAQPWLCRRRGADREPSVAVGRRALGAILAVCLISIATDASAADDHEHPMDSGPPPETAQLDPQTAAVAHRLWGAPGLPL
jgi:hypothetical protein